MVSDPQEAQDRAREAAFEDVRRRGAHLAGLVEDRLSLDISFEGGLQAVATTVTVTFALGGSLVGDVAVA